MPASSSQQPIRPALLSATSHTGWGAGSAATAASTLAPLLFGLMCCALSASSLSAPALVTMVAADAFFTIIGGVMSVLNRKPQVGRVIAVMLVFVPLALMLAIPAVRSDLFAYANSIIYRVNGAYGLFIELVAPGDLVAGGVLFGALLGAATSSCWWALTRLKTSAPALVVATLFCGMGLFLGMGAGVAAAAFAVAGWLVLCRLTQLKGSFSSWVALAANMLVAAAICLLLGGAAVLIYTPGGAAEDVREGIVQGFERLRFGEQVLPEGDLHAAASMNDSSSEHLDIAVSGQPADDVLLRGFVGADYADGVWAPIDHTAYDGDWTGMNSWLAGYGFSSGAQRSLFDDLAAKRSGAKVSTYTLNVNAASTTSRYTFVPYTLRSLDGSPFEVDADGSLRTALWGQARYSLTADSVASEDVFSDASWLAGDTGRFARASRVYGAFAGEAYSTVPKAERRAIKKYLFDDATWDASAAVSDYAVISRVRTMLDTLASYTDTPATPAAKGSFTEWFLGTAHEGNSSYFATVATLAFRSQGIPARYVEGYRASLEDASAAARSGETLSLGSKDIHAWCEVYLDGLGWTPVEVTPGFYTQSVQADSVIDVSEIRGSGKDSDSMPAGSIMGNIEGGSEDKKDAVATGPDALTVIAWVFTAVLSVLVLLVAIVIQRLVRLRLWRSRIGSDDQSIAVPALYRYLSTVMRASGIEFDPTRPLDALDDVENVFGGEVDVKEFRRVIELHQAYAFGCREMRPNELRTVRRITQRMHESLPEPKGVVERFRRYAIDIL